MKKRLLGIPTSLLLTGAVWPVVKTAEEVDSAERPAEKNQLASKQARDENSDN